jgi:putative transposase
MLKISRQAVYQQLDRDFDNVPDVESILTLVRSIREKQPRIGTRKLYSMLGDQLHNLGIGRDRFFDVLRTHQLLVKLRKKYTPTTNSRHEYPVHPNLLIHAPAQRPNEIWVADQTYLLLPKGFCYLSLVTDLWSRKIIG